MFAYIKGTLTFATSTHVVVEANGIGYKIFIPANVFSRLPMLNYSLTLYTSFVVREVGQTLYGFFSCQERDFFEMLMGVTGVGPKLALSLIGHMPLCELQEAILQEDTDKICKIPGIGKKGAGRLIMEMRDKVCSFPSSPELDTLSSSNKQQPIILDAMNALINLGYNQNTAQKAIKKTLQDSKDNIDLATLITTALQHV